MHYAKMKEEMRSAILPTSFTRRPLRFVVVFKANTRVRDMFHLCLC